MICGRWGCDSTVMPNGGGCDPPLCTDSLMDWKLQRTCFRIFFLLWATLANCCKQISMLTSSSTKSSIFNAFRDGSRENIGDITAEGEAQVAVVDMLGIASGVSISRLVVGTSVRSILAVYFILQAMEILGVYRQLRSVEYRVY